MSDCPAKIHGTPNAYRTYRCRCPQAREAVRVEKAAYRKRVYLTGPQLVDRTGTIRRIQALAALGWPVKTVTRMAGLTRPYDILDPRRAVTRSTAARVAAVYDRLSMTVGPSDRARARASRLGWVPPLAWDDEEIDDPAARPRLPRTRIGSAQARMADVEHLRSLGLSVPEVAARLGIHPESLRRALKRSGNPSQKPGKPSVSAEALGRASA